MGTPNCYECKHRRNVPGDAHSSCAHPKVATDDDPFTAMIMAMVGGTRLANPLNVRANPHGIRMGWFMHPFNFDPAWLEACEGFEPIEEKKSG